jgi:hypothetical protein
MQGLVATAQIKQRVVWSVSFDELWTGCCKICKFPSQIRRARRRLVGVIGQSTCLVMMRLHCQQSIVGCSLKGSIVHDGDGLSLLSLVILLFKPFHKPLLSCHGMQKESTPLKCPMM